MTLSELDMTRAVCGSADPATFHKPSLSLLAKNLCHSCPIVAACREATMELEQGWGVKARAGVFGGMTPEERFAEDRRRWPDLQVRKKVDKDQLKAMAS